MKKPYWKAGHLATLGPLLLVMALHIGFRLYLLWTMPVCNDAALTYSDYTARGLKVATSFYPAPNNHVFHSALTTFFYAPGPWQTILFRIPAFSFGIAALLVFYYLTKRHYSRPTALISLMLLGAMLPILHYGYQARGYMILLFFAVAAVSLWLKCKDYPRAWQAFWFVLCLALGIYTIPSYLYFMFTLAVGIGLWHLGKPDFWRVAGRLALYNSLSILLALAFYWPIIRAQGLEVIIANKYVQAREALSISEWLQHFKEVGEYYLLWPGSLALIGLLAILILQMRKKASRLGTLAAGASLSVFVIPFLHQTLPFLRIWMFVAPFYLWVLAEAIFICKPARVKIHKVVLTVSLALIMVLSAVWQWHNLNEVVTREQNSVHYKKLAVGLVKAGYSSMYILDYYGYTFLPYHLKNLNPDQAYHVIVGGQEKLTASEWRETCEEFDVMVLDLRFREDSLARQCLVDTSGAHVLATPESCQCIIERIKTENQQ